ncbi:hypothetical protein BGZ80_001969 [Entomortierella chlamydospora]|uniref:RING-type domain-containing protein n=1 Tax=Entomortierella chlamydospora TaxID=101097 RepID=A0A9P6MQE7_9FUNG|nr:hypothetical protein BGZ80_001969 [Entomortierella chlamydospora]
MEIQPQVNQSRPASVVDNSNGGDSPLPAPSSLQPPSKLAAPLTPAMNKSSLSVTGVESKVSPIISRPPSPAMSGSHLSVNYGEARAASILSRSSSRPASIQQVAATASALMNNPEARRIRMDLYGELVRGWYFLSTSSKVLLIYYTGVTLIEIVTTVTVAVIERESARNCFYLLIFLVLYLLRAIIISILLLRRFLYIRPDDLPRDIGGVCGAHYNTMINWASLVLLIVSISLLTTQSRCAQDSPGLFYLVLVLSLLGYLTLALLLTLWFLVLFCLNGVVALLEMFGVGPRVMQWQGATQEMIDDIPTVKFTKHDQGNLARTSIQEQQDSSLPIVQTEKMGVGMAMTPSIVVSGDTAESHSGEHEDHPASVAVDIEQAIDLSDGIITAFPEGHMPFAASMDDTENNNNMEPEHLSPEERELANRISTTCPICLCEYEDLEELRRLPCDHYFHKECVDEWLKLKRTCPLCKCDVSRKRRGSKFWSYGHSRRSSSGNASGSVPDSKHDEPQLHAEPIIFSTQNAIWNVDSITDSTAPISDCAELGNEDDTFVPSTAAMAIAGSSHQQYLSPGHSSSSLPVASSPANKQRGIGRFLAPLLTFTSSFPMVTPTPSSIIISISDPSLDGISLPSISGPSAPTRRPTRPPTSDGVFVNISAKPEIVSRNEDDQHPPINEATEKRSH